MSHIFISYSLEDGVYTRQLADRLMREGFSIWMDGRTEDSTEWKAAIEKGIEAAGVILVLMSQTSKIDKLVQQELALARGYRRPIAPLLLEGTNWFDHIVAVDVLKKQMPDDAFFNKLKEHVKPVPSAGGNVASLTYGEQAGSILNTIMASNESTNRAHKTTKALVMQADGKFQLIIEQGPESGRTIVLDQNTITIGRERSNAIAIVDAELSRFHARLTLGGIGYVIEDLGSTNGTFVNDARLTQPTVLNNGDYIRFGSYVVLIYMRREEESAKKADAATPTTTEKGTALPTRTGIPRLIMRRGPQLNRVINLNQSVMTIGRLSTNDIVINDAEISRHHSSLSGDAKQGYMIEDLGSTNGTLVNDEKIDGKHKLQHGDTIALGPNIVLGFVE